MNNGEGAAVLLSFRFAARAANLKKMREALSDALEKTGCDEAQKGEIVLATDEACQNIIRHAYGGDTDQPIEMDVTRDGETLTLKIRDFAEPVNVDNIKPRNLDDVRPGGLGTHFMRTLMDEVEIQPLDEEGGNLLHMKKKLD